MNDSRAKNIKRRESNGWLCPWCGYANAVHRGGDG